MSDSITEAEELLDEGHALCVAGLTHLRKALARENVNLLELVAWHQCVGKWSQMLLRPQWPTHDFADEVLANLKWLSERLQPRSPIDGQPFDFVTKL
jgi:hypothetical protein